MQAQSAKTPTVLRKQIQTGLASFAGTEPTGKLGKFVVQAHPVKLPDALDKAKTVHVFNALLQAQR